MAPGKPRGEGNQACLDRVAGCAEPLESLREDGAGFVIKPKVCIGPGPTPILPFHRPTGLPKTVLWAASQRDGHAQARFAKV